MHRQLLVSSIRPLRRFPPGERGSPIFDSSATPRAVSGTILPKAIPFTGTLYSLGLPPELIGSGVLQSLTEEKLSVVEESYRLLRKDFAYACSYLNFNFEIFYVMLSLGVPAKSVEKLMQDVEVACGSFTKKYSQNIEHADLSSKFTEELLGDNLQGGEKLAWLICHTFGLRLPKCTHEDEDILRSTFTCVN